ncbi:MAG: tetratricopeptide repeat protein, partial [Nitrospirae bacterium]|nr:tetratricopeptide repeat protein [Nitrospirota bacterium]
MNIETIKKFLLLLFISIVVVSCSGKKEIQHDVYDPKAYLLKAEQLIEDEEYEEARKLLLEVKNRDYSQKYAPIAQLKIAESLARDNQFEEAIKEYRRFLRLYPDHAQAPYAQYQIALIYYRQIEGPDKGAGGARRALKEFQRLLRDYPRNPYREAVELRIKKCKNLIAAYELMVAKYYYGKGSYHAA